MKKRLPKYQIGTTSSVNAVTTNGYPIIPKTLKGTSINLNALKDTYSLSPLEKLGTGFQKMTNAEKKANGNQQGLYPKSFEEWMAEQDLPPGADRSMFVTGYNQYLEDFGKEKGFTKVGDTWQKQILEEDKNGTLDYSKGFQKFNVLLDATQLIAGTINDIRNQQDEKARLLKAQYPKSSFNTNQRGINNVPMYYQNGGFIPKMQPGGRPITPTDAGNVMAYLRKKSGAATPKQLTAAQKAQASIAASKTKPVGVTGAQTKPVVGQNQMVEQQIEEAKRVAALQPKMNMWQTLLSPALKNLRENVEPYDYYGYDPITGASVDPVTRVYESILQGKKEQNRINLEEKFKAGTATPQDYVRIDLLNMYTNYPQRFKTLVPSKYVPTDDPDKGVKYYSSAPIESELIKGFGDRVFKSKQDIENYVSSIATVKEDPDNPGTYIPIKGKKGNYQATLPALGEGTLGIGQDDKGLYMSYYDKWDLNPVHGVSNIVKGIEQTKPMKLLNRFFGDKNIDLGFGATTPPNVYGRIYFDPQTGLPKYQKGGGSIGNYNVISTYLKRKGYGC